MMPTPARLISTAYVPKNSPIRWCDPVVDDYGVTTLGYYGGWAMQIAVMIFNDRLLLAEPSIYGNPCYGWCYPKGGAAHLAALAWNPDIEGEPAGYIAAKPGGRQAGERAPWWRVPLV